jgi:hypothetical protein
LCTQARTVRAETSRWRSAGRSRTSAADSRYILRDEVDEPTAVGVIWNGGDWRSMVADYAAEHWQVAVRLTQQEAAGAPLGPFPDPYGRD